MLDGHGAVRAPTNAHGGLGHHRHEHLRGGRYPMLQERVHHAGIVDVDPEGQLLLMGEPRQVNRRQPPQQGLESPTNERRVAVAVEGRGVDHVEPLVGADVPGAQLQDAVGVLRVRVRLRRRRALAGAGDRRGQRLLVLVS
uniref:Uncharacterized protein n=1 Tax=Zea mays TaxID=4577 RepID=C4J0G7_MAIZE|nr:unknown [Zea mays]